jgi:hypothetical protein
VLVVGKKVFSSHDGVFPGFPCSSISQDQSLLEPYLPSYDFPFLPSLVSSRMVVPRRPYGLYLLDTRTGVRTLEKATTDAKT